MSDYSWSWFPVRCCCQPQKIFGFIRLPDMERSNVVDKRGNVHKLELRSMANCKMTVLNNQLEYERELAIYSDDRPIEFWRSVVGFLEIKTTNERE